VSFEKSLRNRVDGRASAGWARWAPRHDLAAGAYLVAAAFVRKTEGPYEDLIRPHDWSFAGGGSGGGAGGY